MSEIINVTKSSIPSYEEYCEEIKELWETRWLTNQGVKHLQLERDLKAYLNASNLTLFTNGHLALENIFSAMSLTGEVITTPFTFVSTTNAIVRSGLKPVFCDINPVNYTIDTDKIEALITPATVAIVPVHVYGNICNVEEIQKIADKHNLKVIYDAAHAFGEKYKGVSISSYGDASMFSFHATKVFNTVEGGAAIYRDNSLKDKLASLKNFGIVSNGDIAYAAGNAKMSEFHAAMGICNLRHIDEYIDQRKAVAKRYMDNLKNIDGVVPWSEQVGTEHNYSYFPVVFNGYKYNRDEVCEILRQHGINARKYFYPLTNNCKQYPYGGTETPVAKFISENVLTLPLYPDLSLEDVDRICEMITE